MLEVFINPWYYLHKKPFWGFGEWKENISAQSSDEFGFQLDKVLLELASCLDKIHIL